MRGGAYEGCPYYIILLFGVKECEKLDYVTPMKLKIAS